MLIVGDGIREGAEAMAEFLQQHAGFHFTLAFVEIALFETRGGYIAQLRVPARTTNIERGIVTLEEGRIVIKPPTNGGGRAMMITQEHYFEQLEKEFPEVSQRLTALTNDLEDYNVSPEFGTDCMILRWHADDGKNWNLGTISSHGYVWMDFLGQQAKSAGVPELHKRCLMKLADLVPGASIKKTPKEAACCYARRQALHYSGRFAGG